MVEYISISQRYVSHHKMVIWSHTSIIDIYHVIIVSSLYHVTMPRYDVW